MNLFTSEYFEDWSITEWSAKYTFTGGKEEIGGKNSY